MSGGSFSQGLGEWIGSAEVYDGNGRFAGMGRDTRTVQAEDPAGLITVEVTFEGPFSLSGMYTIADHGTHRTYEGPLNLGFAEVLGDGLIAARNYWPSLGLSQRFFLMVLPDGTHQLSLALLSRGDRLRWTVVGEYLRQLQTSQDPLPVVEPIDPAAVNDDPTAGRGRLLLLRPGRWSGRLHRLGPDLDPSGTVDYVETVAARGQTDSAELADPGHTGTTLAALGDTERAELAGSDRSRTVREALTVELSGLSFAPDASFVLESDGWTAWTPAGDFAGSAALSGGRGLSGHFHNGPAGCRVWRREVASLDGSTKAVLHIWYRGEERLGALYGTLTFNPE